MIIKKTRKQVRKEQRKAKKAKRNDYYLKKSKPTQIVDVPTSKKQNKQANTKGNRQNPANKQTNKPMPGAQTKQSQQKQLLAKDQLDKNVQKEKKELQRLKNEMSKQRKKQLLHANEEEDRTIKRLEKQLKLNKRKSKAIPKSFAEDGLDFLLEVCDPETMKNIAASEQQYANAEDEFEEDFALMTGKVVPKKKKEKRTKARAVSALDDFENELESEEDEFSDDENILLDEEGSSEGEENGIEEEASGSEDEETGSELAENCSEDEEIGSGDEEIASGDEEIASGDEEIRSGDEENGSEDGLNDGSESNEENDIRDEESDLENCDWEDKESANKDFGDFGSEEDEDSGSESPPEELPSTKRAKKEEIAKKRKAIQEVTKKNSKKPKLDESDDEISDYDQEFDEEDSSSESNEEIDKKEKNADVWEDIYGRLRSKDGEVINETTGKYIPPAVRARMEAGFPDDKKRTEQLTRLKRTLKGLFNRLAESNMHGISRQVEDLYMNNSRNDMNDTITSLVLEAVLSPVLTPERLLLEHVMMVTILHANVGTEVGAHFLQIVVKQFSDVFNGFQEVEDKTLDNVVAVIAQLYNFQVFHSQLLYQILNKLTEKFDEKSIECILLVLRNVGFSLRKDDPLALKQLILELQKQSTNATQEVKDNARVKYMMDILLAIKNNNVRKIPNYDTTYSEHLKKLLKGFVRKGCYVTQLNISLDDLLRAEERGKWWVVGSAWTGVIDSTKPTEKSKSEKFSEKILEIARQQRMNTDTRRNIFCNLVVAEDYLDAFGRLLKLGLKGQEEREIMNVLLHCSLKETKFNPYYAVLAQKFCEYDRKYQMMLKCAIWDKLRSLKDSKSNQISNLAKLLSHLFLKKGLPISTLKIIQFTELDKVTLRFMRQVLLGVLLCEDFEECQGVFTTVALSEKLKMFKESIRLFVQHFLLKNLSSGSVPASQKSMLTERAAIIDKLLATHKKFKF